MAAAPLQNCTGVQDRVSVESSRHKKACYLEVQGLNLPYHDVKRDEIRKNCNIGKGVRGKNTMFLVLWELGGQISLGVL
jgi:hypothetical protein